MKNTIRETFSVDIPTILEDVPDRNAEIRVERLSRALASFVEFIADKNTVSCTERDAVISNVTEFLIKYFLSKPHSELLDERLKARNA